MSEGGWGPAGAGQPASGGDDRGSSIRSKIVIVVIAVAVGIAAGAVWVGLAKGPSPAANPAASPAAPAEVRLERTSSPGESPFMSPVGQDQPNVTAPANTGGEFSGDTPGLFADAGDKPSCDAQTLIANLNADPAKASAWATALGLLAKDIPTYVPSLTPVVLRSDTAVTSYGYADGRFFAYPAVLQAGTAVFVNSYGEPKAKCFSGNPLTAPVSNPQANYVGPTWKEFAPTSITIIHRTPTVINHYTFIDIHKGHPVRREAKKPKHDDSHWHCRKNAESEECRETVRHRQDQRKDQDEQPGDRNKQQVQRHDQPGGQDDQPGQQGGPPAPKDDQRAPKDDQPAPKDDQPAPKDDQPAPKDDQPAPKDDQPGPKDDQPAPKDDQPAPQNP